MIGADTAESTNLCMRGNSKRENGEVLLVSAVNRWQNIIMSCNQTDHRRNFLKRRGARGHHSQWLPRKPLKEQRDMSHEIFTESGRFIVRD